MENKIEKTGLRKNFLTILLLAFAGAMIYGLPYFRYYYYDAYVAAYNLNNTQMGTLGSAFGVMGVASYLIGGVLADKLPAKMLLNFSLVATGLGGFLHLFFTNFTALVVIYGLWGVTSLLTFWPALMKIVRTQAHDDEQSRAYGLFEGGRGVTNAVHMAIATAIFAFFNAKAMPELGLRWIITFYSIFPIVCAAIFHFILKEPIKTENSKSTKTSFKDIFTVFKMPAVWMVVIITYTTYTFNLSYYYFTPYATNIMGLSAVVAAVITVLAQYARPVASPVGGALADKFGKSQVMIIGFIIMGLTTILIMFVPNFSVSVQTTIMVAACLVFYLGMYSNFGIYFSMLSEGGVPLEVSGVAIGIVSTLGYLPEVVSPMLAGRTLDAVEGIGGYYQYFYYMLGCAVVGIITCIIWSKTYGKKAKEEKLAK
jgi:MFS family permease